MDLISLGYFGMFLAAFLAATILPFSSEVVFTTLYWQNFSPFWLVFWASLGNILGGMTCYALGLLGKMEWIEKWMKIKTLYQLDIGFTKTAKCTVLYVAKKR